jgi:hypothetical protein
MLRAKRSHGSGASSVSTKLAMPSLCSASATKPARRAHARSSPVSLSLLSLSIRQRGSSSPSTAVWTLACGLSARRRAVNRSTLRRLARSVFEITSRSARMACFLASADHSRVSRPVAASDHGDHHLGMEFAPSARSVAKVCRIGPGSASPLVSINIR